MSPLGNTSKKLDEFYRESEKEAGIMPASFSLSKSTQIWIVSANPTEVHDLSILTMSSVLRERQGHQTSGSAVEQSRFGYPRLTAQFSLWLLENP